MGETRACTSTSSGRRPSTEGKTTLPGHLAVPAGHQPPRRVGDGLHAGVAHLEQAHLVGGPEAVLEAAQHPQPPLDVALEVQHHIDGVLEQARPGDGAVLGDVADQDHRHPALLGEVHQAGRRFAHLGHPPGRPPHLGGGHRLDGVDHQQVGPHWSAAATMASTSRSAASSTPGMGQARGARPAGRPGRPTPRRWPPGRCPRPRPGRPPPGAAGWTCPLRARPPPAAWPRAPGPRRAPGRPRRCRCGGAPRLRARRRSAAPPGRPAGRRRGPGPAGTSTSGAEPAAARAEAHPLGAGVAAGLTSVAHEADATAAAVTRKARTMRASDHRAQHQGAEDVRPRPALGQADPSQCLSRQSLHPWHNTPTAPAPGAGPPHHPR